MDHYSTTFVNGDQELINEGRKLLDARLEDFELMFDWRYCDLHDVLIGIDDPMLTRAAEEECACEVSELSDHLIDKISEHFDTSMNEYGLDFSYVELGTFNKQPEDYFRYQLSWGGPGDEIRFYQDGRIEYVYLEQGTGVGFDITNSEEMERMGDYFHELLDFDTKREETNYYELVLDLEDE